MHIWCSNCPCINGYDELDCVNTKHCASTIITMLCPTGLQARARVTVTTAAKLLPT